MGASDKAATTQPSHLTERASSDALREIPATDVRSHESCQLVRQSIPGKTGEWCAAETAGCLTKVVGNRTVGWRPRWFRRKRSFLATVRTVDAAGRPRLIWLVEEKEQ